MFISHALDARRKRHRSGFTLIEIIGVLALIAVLAALLSPKIFEAIHNARLRQAVIEVQTMRTAVTEHYGRYGVLATSNGVALTITTELTNFDRILLNEAIIDKPFRSRLATNAFVRLVSTSGFTSSTSIDRENGAYDLDGNGANDVIGAYAVLVGITEEDAVALAETTPKDVSAIIAPAITAMVREWKWQRQWEHRTESAGLYFASIELLQIRRRAPRVS